MIEARVTYRVDRKAFDGLMRVECRKRMRATVEALVGESRRIVPVRTGNLRSSLTAEVSADGLIGWYGSNRPWRGEASVHYAAFVEFGTRRMEPRPYLRPPLVTMRGEVQRIWSG